MVPKISSKKFKRHTPFFPTKRNVLNTIASDTTVQVVHRLVGLVGAGALTSIWRTFSEATFFPACLGVEADAPHDGVGMTSVFAILCHCKTSILEAVRKSNWNFQLLVTPVMELVQRGERPKLVQTAMVKGVFECVNKSVLSFKTWSESALLATVLAKQQRIPVHHAMAQVRP
jgi:hypothetical protein